MLAFLIVLLLGVAIGTIRGGSFSNLSRAHLSIAWMIIVAAALQLGANLVPRSAGGLAYVMVIASYAALAIFAAANWRAPGMWMIALGAAMNFLVITVNGGMPISEQAARVAGYSGDGENLLLRGKHILDSTGSAKLRLLSDIIPLWRQPSVASVGDLILWAGMVFLIAHLVRGPRGRHEASPTAAGQPEGRR